MLGIHLVEGHVYFALDSSKEENVLQSFRQKEKGYFSKSSVASHQNFAWMLHKLTQYEIPF